MDGAVGQRFWRDCFSYSSVTVDFETSTMTVATCADAGGATDAGTTERSAPLTAADISAVRALVLALREDTAKADLFSQLCRNTDTGGIDDEQMVRIFVTILFGAFDTTSAGMTSMADLSPAPPPTPTPTPRSSSARRPDWRSSSRRIRTRASSRRRS